MPKSVVWQIDTFEDITIGTGSAQSEQTRFDPNLECPNQGYLMKYKTISFVIYFHSIISGLATTQLLLGMWRQWRLYRMSNR